MYAPNEVILIEDNPFDAELTMEALRSRKIVTDVVWLKNGEEALDFLDNGSLLGSKPKLILLDLKLPKVDGIKVLEKIKTHQNAQLIPVVMLTSSNQINDKLSSFQRGANSYVVKPVDYDEFKAAIEEVGMYWLLRNAPCE